MNFTAEELRRLWLALYRDEVARLAQASDRHYPGDLHNSAALHADIHLSHFQPPQVGFSRADL